VTRSALTITTPRDTRANAMSRIYRSAAPLQEPSIGIAFSGGLDTRCRRRVADEARASHVYAYTADLAQPDEKNAADIPPIATKHGAVKAARLIDCREAMVREGITAIQCGAFHLHPSAAASTSTPRRSAAPSPRPPSCAR
jgi:argininosuccinate synthase